MSLDSQTSVDAKFCTILFEVVLILKAAFLIRPAHNKTFKLQIFG